MTPDDWKSVEAGLFFPFERVKLKCDGFDVALMVRPIKSLRNGIYVYVNGKLDYKYLIEDCEERRRFYRRIEKPKYSPAEQKDQKRLAKLLKRPSRHNENFVSYREYWTDFTAMRRHFCKHNQNIQLIRETL